MRALLFPHQLVNLTAFSVGVASLLMNVAPFDMQPVDVYKRQMKSTTDKNYVIETEMANTNLLESGIYSGFEVVSATNHKTYVLPVVLGISILLAT